VSQGAAGRAGNLFAQAVMLHQQGVLSEAERGYRLVLAADKNHAGALQYLAMIEGQRGNFTEAVRLLRQCVKAHPRLVEARTNLGFALAQTGQHAEAVACYDKALSIDPKFVAALNNRGISLREMGRLDDAVANYDRLIAIKSDFADAHYNRGNLLTMLGRYAEAHASFERALALTPNDASALIGYATALRKLGRGREAVTVLDRVLVADPNNVLALVNRGHILSDLQAHADAIASYGKALQIDSTNRQARSPLAWAALAICDWSLAEPLIDELKTHLREKRSVVQAFAFLACSDDPALQQACAQSFVTDAIPVLPQPLCRKSPHLFRSPRDRIRIGYLSADFRRHPTVHLVARLLELHDRSKFMVIGVSTGEDDASAERRRIIDAVDDFLDVSARSDRETAQLIYQRGVDILVDLNAHTRSGRLGILAHRPAPLQVNYLGYPGTAGASFVDYVIADETILPTGSDTFFTEKIVRLPDYYVSYHLGQEISQRISQDTPARERFGLPENAFVYCSFNNSYKIRLPVFAVWMRLLRAVDGSVLWLLLDNQTAADNLRKEAAKFGVDPALMIFAPRVELSEHLGRQRCADLFLDTVPVNAHTTACDALWMGLPIVTCSGKAFAARVAASALTSCGLSDLVATNLDDYEALALKLATDPALLASIRNRLADARATAPVFDPDRLCRQMEAAYLRMWDTYRAGDPPQGFSVDRG
jgi:protein O-GlcNAc transferase